MKFRDIQQALDVRSDKERVEYLERTIPRLNGPALRSAMIALANLYVMHREFEKAANLYEIVGMHEQSMQARTRL